MDDNIKNNNNSELNRVKIERTKSTFSLRRFVGLVVVLTLIISSLRIGVAINFAADEVMNWRKNDTMDINLNTINNKAGATDVFFQMDVEDAGTYTLTYFLEENRRTTVTFDNNYSEMEVKFKVQEYDPTGVATVPPADPPLIEVTETLADLSFLEINYDQQVPGWQFIADKEVDAVTNTIDYTISRSASAKYPGIAFEMDNKKFIAKWDFQANVLYVLFDQYENGHIMPVTFDTPQGDSQTIKVLKGLEDFNISPTYLVDDGAGGNEELSTVVHPNSNNDKPGNRPGLKINFKQPRELNEADWSYVNATTDLQNIRAVFEIADIGSADYLDFNFMMQDALGSIDKQINEIPIENGDQTDPLYTVEYSYSNYEYEVLIVEDKSDLNLQTSIIQWDDLASSKIYNANVGFQIESALPEYEFSTFYPENNFAYTYLEYQLKRSDQQEAFIEIVPYDVGSQDEIEYIVLYSKLVSDELDPTNDLWLKHYQSAGDNSSTINIPVPFRANSYQDAYQILVNFSNTDLASQVLNYRAVDDLNVPPTTPKIESIENIFVVPPESELSENPTKIQFDLIWEAIDNRATGELDAVFANTTNALVDAVYYEVLVNDIPEDDDANPFQVFRVYEVYKDVDGLYKVRVHGDTTATDTPGSNTFEGGYDSLDELFKMEEIEVYLNELWTPRIDTVYDEDLDTYTITERTLVSHPSLADYQTSFEFPGVNYIRIRAITETDGVLGVSNYSVPVSLSLSMLEYDIPIAEGITYEPFYSLIESDPMGVILNWPAIDISNYENNMLYPLDKEINDPLGITYSVYLSQDKDALLDLNEDDAGYSEVFVDAGGDMIIDDATLLDLRGKDVDGNGNIIFFDVDRDRDSVEDINTRIEGLDLNNTYYVRIVVKPTIHDIIPDTTSVRRGKPSSVVSITTPIVPPEPGDDEIIPLAPENVTVDFLDETQLSATVSWTIPEEVTVELDTFGFEVLAIEDKSLPIELRSKDIDIVDILNHEAMDERVVELWRIFYEGTDVVLKKYDEDTSTWVNQDIDLIQMSDGGIQMVDDNNSPNRVNYYYVRTINVESGASLRASTWLAGTITTAPVQGPINLIIDYNSEHEYEGRVETIIRFDAPIPDTAVIDTDFVMEVFVKGEEDIDFVECVPYVDGVSDKVYSSELLPEPDNHPVGFKRLSYRIKGLIPGKQYEIKVRIEDRTKALEILPDGSESYPKSPFSDKVTTRTEFSQDDYDKEIKYKQYIDYYLKEAEKLTQNPYYQLATNDEKATLKYRLKYADGLVRTSQGQTYELVALEKQSNIYYIPAELITTANDFNVTLLIEPNNQQVALHPFSIGEEITAEIIQMVNDISAYGSELEYYYVQLIISVGTYNGKINGQDPSSPLVNVQMNVIGSKINEEDIDIILEYELDTIVNQRKNNLIELLDNELDLGINDTKLTTIVQSVMGDVKSDFYEKGQLALEDNLDIVKYPIKNVNKNITIGISADEPDGSNQLYSKTTGDWKSIEAAYYGLRYHISSKELGSFMSVKRSGSEELANIYTTKQLEMLNKYSLTDLFTSFALQNPEEVIMNTQMTRTFARLVGASDLDDNTDYLENLGIDVPYYNEYSILTRDLANYLYVQVYALKNHINLDAVVISDYNRIEDINSVNSAYRNVLLKGVSLDIIELEQEQLMPSTQVSLEEFFRLIDNIE